MPWIKIWYSSAVCFFLLLLLHQTEPWSFRNVFKIATPFWIKKCCPLKENRPVIDNHIVDSKSSSITPPSPTSLGSRGNRNNWDVYGLKNLLFCHHLQSYTGCFSYNSLAYSSHCFIVYICWILTAGAGEKTSLTTGETTTGFAGILW